jgi:hypothetical protein
MIKREWKGEPLWLYQLWWRWEQDPNKMTARKIWDLPVLYSLLDVMCSVCWRGGCVQYTCIGGEGGTDKWGRKLNSCWYTAHSSLGMTLIRANTLAFGLIGKTDHIESKNFAFGLWIWYLEARSRYSDFGNICFEFSLECSNNIHRATPNFHHKWIF